MQDIETSAQRAAELTRQMLAYSGRGKFVVEPLNLSHVVQEMTQLLGRVISKRARLSLHLRDDVPHGSSPTRTQLRQVVMNLITNASDALGGEPGLVSRCEPAPFTPDARMLAGTYLNEELPAGEYVYLEVTDSGVGHGCRDSRAHLRAVLHDEVHGPRPRPGGGAGHRPRPQGRYRRHQRARLRHDVPRAASR